MQRGILFAILLSLAGCTGDGGDSGGDGATRVEASDHAFQVQGDAASRNGEATAAVGDTFTFRNVGQADHTVTVHRPPDPATTYLIDEVIEPGDEVDFTFDAPGTYHVYCKYHGEFTSGMRLTVTVA